MSRARLRKVILAASTVGLLLSVSGAPASAVPAPKAGPGTMAVSPPTVWVNSEENTLTFTYTAAPTGVTRGTLTLAIPSGWTAPQKQNPQDLGFVSASAGKLSVSKSIVSVKKLTRRGSATFTITYTDASAPPTTGPSTFLTAVAAKGKKTRPLASSPVVNLVNPSPPVAT
jgi:hypothetical protein